MVIIGWLSKSLTLYPSKMILSGVTKIAKQDLPRLILSPTLAVSIWLAWAFVVLLSYYKQLWSLLISGTSSWDMNAFEKSTIQLLVIILMTVFILFVSRGLKIGFYRLVRHRSDNLPQGSFYWAVGGFLAIVCFFLFYKKPWHLLTTKQFLHSFTAFFEAAWRAILGGLSAGLVLLAAYVLGLSICHLLGWKSDEKNEALLYRSAVGLGTMSYLLFGLASLGLYRSVNVKILLVCVILCGGMWFFIQFICRNRKRMQVIHFIKCAPTGDQVWKAIVLMSVLIALTGALAPEIEYDALWYHLNFPKLWLKQGGLIDLPAEYISLYPMTWELIFGVGLTLYGAVSAKLLHFACFILVALLVYQMTHRFMPRSSPWLATVFFVTIPTVLWEATTAYIDLALTLHVGLVIYALLRYFEERQWQWFGLAVFNLGLALATKHLAWFVLILVATGLALKLWFESHNLQRTLMPVFLLILLSLLIPLPWYIRSWQASGNPFFPELFSIFGAQPAERWDDITQRMLNHFLDSFGRPRTVINLLTLPWDMTVHAAHYGGTLGPQFLLLIPALILIRPNSKLIRWMGSFVLLYLALWASPVSSFQMRFLLPITPFLAVFASEACCRLTLTLRSSLATSARFLFQIGLVVLFLFNLPPFIPFHEVDRKGWDGWLTHVVRHLPMAVLIGIESQEDYLVRSLPSYAAWRHINSNLSENAHILSFSGGDHFYSERKRIWSNASIVRQAVWGVLPGQEREALNILAKLGISHILFDKKQIRCLRDDALALAQPFVIKSWYNLGYEDSHFVLYRLRWEGMSQK